MFPLFFPFFSLIFPLFFPSQDSAVKPRRVADARVTLSHTRDDSEKVTDEEMDEMIEIVEVACSITQVRIPERIAEQIAARTCRKEQTVEAMKMIPQERVSNRIVKQIMDKPEAETVQTSVLDEDEDKGNADEVDEDNCRGSLEDALGATTETDSSHDADCSEDHGDSSVAGRIGDS